MQRTLRLAQRSAASAKAVSTRAAPLPYAPPRLRNAPVLEPADQPQPMPQATPTRPAPVQTSAAVAPQTTIPRMKIEVGSAEYKQAANKYTRAMIAMPILLLTSYVLYNRFVAGVEVKTLPGAEDRSAGPRLVVLDK